MSSQYVYTPATTADRPLARTTEVERPIPQGETDHRGDVYSRPDAQPGRRIVVCSTAQQFQHQLDHENALANAPMITNIGPAIFADARPALGI